MRIARQTEERDATLREESKRAVELAKEDGDARALALGEQLDALKESQLKGAADAVVCGDLAKSQVGRNQRNQRNSYDHPTAIDPRCTCRV